MTTKRMARLRQIRVVFFLLGICYRLHNPAGDRSQSAGIYAHYKACVPHQPTSATADSSHCSIAWGDLDNGLKEAQIAKRLIPQVRYVQYSTLTGEQDACWTRTFKIKRAIASMGLFWHIRMSQAQHGNVGEVLLAEHA